MKKTAILLLITRFQFLMGHTTPSFTTSSIFKLGPTSNILAKNTDTLAPIPPQISTDTQYKALHTTNLQV